MVPVLMFENILQRGTAAWNEIKWAQPLRKYVRAFDGQLRLKVPLGSSCFSVDLLRCSANVLVRLLR